MESAGKKIASSMGEKVNISFESLPEHVMQRIKNYFSSPELNLNNLRETWSSVSDHHPMLWLKIGFRGEVTSAHMICRILQNSPLLESLHLVNVPDIVSILQQLCRCCRQLKHLKVRFCYTDGKLRSKSVPEASLRNIIYSCPNLISLDLKGTPFSGKKFYQDLAYLRKLRALKLGCNSHLCSQDLFTIATVCRGRLTHLSILHSVHGIAPPPKALYGQEALKTWTHIEKDYLRCQSQVLTTREFTFLMKMLGAGLVSLELEVTVVEANAFHLICDLCTNLHSLHLFNAMNLPGDVVQRIPTAMPHLTYLTIRRAYLLSEADIVQLFFNGENNKLSDSGSTVCSTVSLIDDSVVTSWWEGGFLSDESDSDSEESQTNGDEIIWKEAIDSSLPVMRSLDLSMCTAMTDAALEVLTEGYLVNTLQTLRIRGCEQVTSKGLHLLPRCFKLRHLDVSFVDFKKGPSAEWLKGVPISIPYLNALVVGFWKEDAKTKEAMEDISEQMPSLKIKKLLSFYNSKKESFCRTEL